MRIISGKYRGRKLSFVTTDILRPTQDRIKESVFNVIHKNCDEAVVLDAFAGSGSLGLEALSRGAHHVVFVDKNIDYIKKNTEWIEDQALISIKKMSALSYLKSTSNRFDIIFLDPPWKKPDLFEHSLKAIFDFDILNMDGVIVCEHDSEHINFNQFECFKMLKFNKKNISLLRKPK